MATGSAIDLVGASSRAQGIKATINHSPTERLAIALGQARTPIEFDGLSFSGQGYDWLLSRGSTADAFLLGEEHGIAENPKLAAQLFKALVPYGYSHVAVEISSPMASALNQALLRGGPTALRQMLTSPESRVAFFGLREEAEWLAAAQAAAPPNPQFLWGLDYEVAADRYLIRQLKKKAKPAAAATALDRLESASKAAWARFDGSHNPQFIFSFSGDPKLVQNLQHEWPRADADARLTMATLEQTLEINARWVSGDHYGSNLLRSRFMRANLVRYWQAMRGRPSDQRLFMKFGASHMVRGLSMSDVFDLGTLVPELAAVRGGRAFHLLVLPGPGAQTSNLDPTTFRYEPGNRAEYAKGMAPFNSAVIAGKFTLFDTAPLRPIVGSSTNDFDRNLVRVIHGFDAVLVMTGSHPSTNI